MFLTLEPNTQGCDYIISDIHGNLSLLKSGVEKLQPGDRLMIVGDIVDRGEESLDCILYIIEQRTQGKEIYCVRGNHEEMLGKALSLWNLAFEAEIQRVKRVRVFSPTLSKDVQTQLPDDGTIQAGDLCLRYRFNGMQEKIALLAFFALGEGEFQSWQFLPHFNGELTPSLIEKPNEIKCYASTYSHLAAKITRVKNILSQGSYPYLKTFQAGLKQYLSSTYPNTDEQIRSFCYALYLLLINGGAWVLDLTQQQRAEVLSFVAGMPYALRVKGQYDAVHAAPLPPFRMDGLFSGQEQPTAQEINYLLWARLFGRAPEKTLMQHHYRTRMSLLTYVGHNPMYGFDGFKAISVNSVGKDSRIIYAQWEGENLIISWFFNERLYEKSLPVREVADIASLLPEQGYASENMGLIDKIVKKYGCGLMQYMDQYKQWNMICVDVGTFDTGCVLCVNHTKSSVSMIIQNGKNADTSEPMMVAGSIKAFLLKRKNNQLPWLSIFKKESNTEIPYKGISAGCC